MATKHTQDAEQTHNLWGFCGLCGEMLIHKCLKVLRQMLIA